MAPSDRPYCSSARLSPRGLKRHGRNTIARITAAKVSRIAVAPAAPTTGNRCLASEAPVVSETRDNNRAA
ncbi:hypothetical protein ACEN88_32610 [Massilia sp. CT11-108]|uniref:hypothetical protein n=1 Tax=Massilia sp. CT11-108 TaxID=3393900 RepID=UPI0039A41131